jgi:hypothetical protein
MSENKSEALPFDEIPEHDLSIDAKTLRELVKMNRTLFLILERLNVGTNPASGRPYLGHDGTPER